MPAGAQLSQRLMSTFLVELDEHARAMERDLLALERGEGTPAQIHTSLFRSTHSLKGAARVVGVNAIETACHSLEEIVQALRDGRLIANRALFQLLLSAADALSATGRLLAEKREAAGGPLGALLPKLAAAMGEQPSAGHGTSRQEEAPVAAAAAPAMPLRDATVRVQAGKLDALLVQDGELLVARRRASGHAAAAERLLQQARDAQREGRTDLREITRELQDFAGRISEDAKLLDLAAGKLSNEIRQMRLLPFAQACDGLDRLVRDLSAGSGKDVSLSVGGGEIGIDRSILERLRDPLMHLVRNAIDHGIEPAQARRANGKASAGRIAVSASLSGPQIVVKVRDDGRGIDSGAVRAQAERRGIVPSGALQSEHDIIFETGFTTLSSVSKISGRGVGLDVVKAAIEEMRGAISVATEAGKGTEFTIVLPLTLTSIRGLLIGCGGQTFALDSTMVRGLRRVSLRDVRLVEGRSVLIGDGDPLPFASLNALLGLEAAVLQEDALIPVVLLGAGAAQAAIAVDALFDEDDLTVRNLGSRFGRMRNVSGGTILPDGRVALILHAGDIIATALEGKEHSPFVRAQSVTETKKRLVIAEDSMTTRTLIKAILENAGYDVAAAADGAEALRLIQQNGADLIIADVEMPKMDGFALTETIRSSTRHREIPIVLLTALESDRDKTRGLSAGANAYLLKSAFDQRDLLAAIRQMV